MSRRAAIIGVPLDLGANRRGVDMGPSALRVTGLAGRIRSLGYHVEDRGDVHVPLPEEAEAGDRSMKYAGAILDVCERLCRRSLSAQRDGFVPVVLGGDHSLAMGSIAGTALHQRDQGRSVGL